MADLKNSMILAVMAAAAAAALFVATALAVPAITHEKLARAQSFSARDAAAEVRLVRSNRPGTDADRVGAPSGLINEAHVTPWRTHALVAIPQASTAASVAPEDLGVQ